MKKTMLFILCLFAMLRINYLSAQAITDTLYPCADVFVTTYGGGEGLNSFLKFDISSIPAIRHIDQVKLNVYITDIDAGWDGDIFFCNANSQTWVESDFQNVLWNIPRTDTINQYNGFGETLGWSSSTDLISIFLKDYYAQHNFCTVFMKDMPPEDMTSGTMVAVPAEDSPTYLKLGNFNYISFYPHEYTDATLIPQLIVTYSPPSSETDIITYSFPEQTGPANINDVTHTVDIEVAMGTDLSNLTATFSLSDDAYAKIGGVTQVSGTTVNNFTSAVTYTITAEDIVTTQNWTINVTEATALNNENDFLSFSFPDETSPAIIDTSAHTIDIEVIYGLNLTALIATFTTSPLSTAKVGGVLQTSGVTPNDFTGPVTYVVIAEDATPQAWTVTVTNASPPQGALCANPISLILPVIDLSGTTYGYGNDYSTSNCFDVYIEQNDIVYEFTLTEDGFITGSISTGDFSSDYPGMHILDACPGSGESCIAIACGGDGGSFTEQPISAGSYFAVVSNRNWGPQFIDFTMNLSFRPVSSENDILTYSFPEQTGPAIIDTSANTIDVEVIFGTDVTTLIADFILSDYATADISGAPQTSGVTPNDFTGPVIYKITAEDGTTIQNWTVTVTVAATQSSENDILTYSFPQETDTATIDTTAHTIDIEIIYGIDVTNLIANFTLSDFATAKVGAVPQTSGVTSNDFTGPVVYNVTAEDGTPQAWTVTVSIAAPPQGAVCANPFPITLPIEDYSGTTYGYGNDYNTSNCNDLYIGGNEIIGEFTLLDDGFISGSIATADGMAYYPGMHILDDCPGTGENCIALASGWKNGYFNNSTISAGTYIVVISNDTTWAPESYDFVMNLSFRLPNTENDILAYSFPEQTSPAIIDTSANTIDVEVVFGTDVTTLVADFVISDFATAEVTGVPQTSGVTPNDFTSPVIYKITAEDGTTIQNWTVTVTIDIPSSENDILTYSFPEQTGPANINDIAHTVTLEVSFGTNVANLIADFTLSDSATAEVTGVPQTSSVTPNDFTGPVIYKITAEDGTTIQNWTVTVTVATPSSENDIINYSFLEQTGPATIDTSAHTVTLEVSFGTNVTNLIADFTLSAVAIADIGGIPQTSGVTSNDFTLPVIYTVTAEDTSATQDWTVTVTITLPNTENDILTYSFPEQTGPAVIDATAHTVTLEVSFGTNVANLIADFTLSAVATADIGGIPQTSGVTSNDFTLPVIYTVTAEDTSATQDWTVTVTIAASQSNENDFLTYSFPEQTGPAVINTTAHTVALEVSFGTNVANLIADFTLSDSATAEVTGVPQTSSVTPNDFTGPVIYKITAEDGTTIQNWTVTVTEEPVNITDFSNINSQITVYPNPNKGIFNIVVKTAKKTDLIIELMNIQGQIIYRNDVKRILIYKGQVDVSDFAKGIYFLRINTVNQVKIRKIVIQ